jgi:hypothetical protein
MTDDRLTDLLATRVLGWKPAPDRFLKPDRGWTPRWQFAPFKRIEDAFLLLDRAGDYTLRCVAGVYTVQVRVGNCTGKAAGDEKARTITLAVAEALGLELPR